MSATGPSGSSITSLAGGPVPASVVRNDALLYGISLHTLRRAADDLEVIRSHPRGGRGCTWRLP